MIDYKDVGARIRAARLSRRMTQEKLADAAGVGVTHISHIETGNSVPSLQVFVDILNALGCSADELLCLEVAEAQPRLDGWLNEVFADCTDKERKLLVDTMLAVKASMRRLKIESGER